MGLPWKPIKQEVALPRLGDVCLGQTINFHKFSTGLGLAYTGIVTEIRATLMETLTAWSHENSNGQFWSDIRIVFVDQKTGKSFMLLLGGLVQLDQETQKFRQWSEPQGEVWGRDRKYRLSNTMIYCTHNRIMHTLSEIITTDLFSRWDARFEKI